MKKILFSIIAAVTVIGATAQYNPIETYPNTPGDVIVTKSYDAKGTLLATMKYTVADSRIDEHHDYLEISFTITNAKNEVVDYGTIYASYEGEDFALSMSNRPETVNVNKYLSLNTKMMNDFLDYPNPFANNPLVSGPFSFGGADYTIKVGERNRDFINVKVSGRDWADDEKIKTPAGTFHASKINFGLEVYNNDTKKTDKYKATEWYVVNKGIVRTEIRDMNGNLVDYSVVTEFSRK